MTLGLGRTLSVALSGLDGTLVDVEAHIAQGLPHFAIGGLPDTACAQAPDRVRPAAATSGVPVPPHRVTVNLSPASIPKRGACFDLPIAVAVLAAAGCCPGVASRRGPPPRRAGPRRAGPARARRAAGGARGRAPRGAPRRRAARNVAEAQLVDGVTVHGARTSARRRRLVRRGRAGRARCPGAGPRSRSTRPEPGPTSPMSSGSPRPGWPWSSPPPGATTCSCPARPASARRCSPNGSSRCCPRSSREESLEAHAIRSLTGQVADVGDLDRTPPFVAPHHSSSSAAVAGGGSGVVVPGAISRAHHGVLFLDEAPEFKATVLQVLRQPLESGEVVIARARQVVRFPARFLLVLAANPCPCGRAWGKGLGLRLPADGDAGVCRAPLGAAAGPGRPPGARPPGAAGGLGRRAGSQRRRGRPGGLARDAQRARWADGGWVTNGLVPGHVLRRHRSACRAARPPCSTGSSTADGSPFAGTTGCCGCRGPRPTSPDGRCPTVTTSPWG